MIRFRFLFMTALTIFILTIGNAQKHNRMIEKEFNNEEKAVLAAVQKMTKAFHQKDIKGVMDSYEPQAMVIFEPELAVSDTDKLKTMFEGAFTVDPRFEYDGHEVFVNGDLAMHISPWTMTGKAPDGTAIRQNGLSVAILRKQADGKWLMIFDNPHGQHLMDK